MNLKKCKVNKLFNCEACNNNKACEMTIDKCENSTSHQNNGSWNNSNF